MCGILGEYIFGASLLDKNIFLTLLSKSNSRGPDSNGYYSNGRIQFGFNRLAILDLSDNANQPIHSFSRRFTMIYNGEIYNHQEIRKLLPKDRYKFRGNGDTETLINCFEHFGVIKTIKMLDGMFSIGIFDHQESTLHLIRDFAGIKPLHYGICNGGIIFSSQYDQIVGHPFFNSEKINPSVLRLYLEQHFVPAPNGIIKNTFQVEPGEIISFDKTGKKSNLKYWELSDFIKLDYYDEEHTIEKVSISLKEAIKDELIADVPIGAFLSGGIDSSLICKYASDLLSSNFDSFSIGSDSKKHDESKIAKEYARKINANFHLDIINNSNIINIFNEAMDAITGPIADFSIIPTYQVCKNAKNKIKVALSGDGGDELFFGYDRHWAILKNRYIQEYPYSFKYFIYGIDKIITNNNYLNSGVLWGSSSLSYRYSQSKFPKYLIDSIAPNISNVSIPFDWNSYKFPHSTSKRELSCYIRNAEFYTMMQKTLMKVDMASMANSIEVRVPFLKKTMIELALRIDPLLNINNQGRKRILYKLNEKAYPNNKATKLKRGFSVPLSSWIRKGLKETFGDLILSKTHIDDFGFSKNNIAKIFDDHLNKKADYHFALFTIYSLFKWNEKVKK